MTSNVRSEYSLNVSPLSIILRLERSVHHNKQTQNNRDEASQPMLMKLSLLASKYYYLKPPLLSNEGIRTNREIN